MNTEAHIDRAHSKLAPSSIERNRRCLTSLIPPEGGIVDTDTEYSREGTVAHEMLECVLRNGMRGFKTYKPAKPEDLKFVTLEMKQNVNESYQFIRNKLHIPIGEKNLYKFVFESRVKYSEHIYGTLDVGFLYVKDGIKKGIVFDLKYGAGTPVEAKENEQLMTYGVALCDTHHFDAQEITLIIHQPRDREDPDRPFRIWKMDSKRIKQWRSELKKFEKKAVPILEGDYEKPPKEVVGKHCKFCPRKPACIPYAKESSVTNVMLLNKSPIIATTTVVDESYRVQNGVKLPARKVTTAIQPDMLTLDQKIEVWKKSDQIISFIKAVIKDIQVRISYGEKIPGLKLVAGRSNRKWIANEEMVGEFLEEQGIDDPYVKKLITITEAEKKIGKGKLEQHTYKSLGKPKLALLSDKRPALQLENAQDMLGVLEDDENDDD